MWSDVFPFISSFCLESSPFSTEHLGGGGKAGPLFATTEIEGDQR
jgi:hypothetical protein